MDIHPAFAVPFGQTVYPDPDRLNSALREVILGMERSGDEFRNPNPLVQQPPGLYESKFEFFARSEACIQTLRTFCWKTLADLIRAVSAPVEDEPPPWQIMSQTWFHVTRTGGHFGYHNHPMASWSGVYCVADGQPDAGVPNNGALVFPHPLAAANSFLDPATANLQWPFSRGNLSMNLSPGHLVLFPSWLGHYVTPFVGEAERITVAFNAWFVLQPSS